MSPLKKGNKNIDISKNIAKLMDEGKSQQQAIAIAMKEAGRSKKKAKSKKK